MVTFRLWQEEVLRDQTSVSWFSIREWKKFMEVVVEAVWMWELARDYVCSAMKYRKQGVFMGGEKVELIETINI